MIPPITGRCLCGAVSYRVEAAPLWQAHCHCESCRRATSAGFASYFGVADGQWHWTGAAPAVFASTPGVERSFCARCGSPLAYRGAAFPGEMHFHAATLDEPERFQPTVHVHTDEQLPWVRLSDGLRRK